ALSLHHDVKDCVCFSAFHPTLGQCVAAAVVLHPQASLDEAALRNFLRGRLSQFKVPVRIVQWDEIPRGWSTGKPQRAEASEKFARLFPPASRIAVAYTPGAKHQTPLVRSLARLWCEV